MFPDVQTFNGKLSLCNVLWWNFIAHHICHMSLTKKLAIWVWFCSLLLRPKIWLRNKQKIFCCLVPSNFIVRMFLYTCDWLSKTLNCLRSKVALYIYIVYNLDITKHLKFLLNISWWLWNILATAFGSA